MLQKEYITIYQDAIDYEGDRMAFASDWALSNIWGDDNSSSQEIMFERFNACAALFDIAKMSMVDMIRSSGMSGLAFSERFGIKYRTVQAWTGGEQKQPAAYVKLLLAESLGLVA